jgi:SAM-dependent methyltransferase
VDTAGFFNMDKPSTLSIAAPNGPPASDALKVAATHWDARVTQPMPQMSQWWQFPQIKRHMNRIICGRPVDGMTGGDAHVLKELAGDRPYPKALSIGCGIASKEIALLRSGAVEKFVVYEISTKRIGSGKRAAKRYGISDRIEFHNEAVEFDIPPPETFDLVYWNNSLHHMLDVRACLTWCRSALRPGGVIYLNDFVGPTRMQWPDEMIDVANHVRGSLPERLLLGRDGTSKISPKVARPSLRKLVASDPTECADSGAILGAFQDLFPENVIRCTGGVVYHLALKGCLHNFTTEPDDEILSMLLATDEVIARLGMTHYAMAYARLV